MSQDNADVVRRATDYFNETGEPGPMELHDPGVTFTTRGDLGSKETYTGHQGLVEGTASFREVWAGINAHITELTEGDDVVVAVFRFDLRSQAGVDLEIEEAWAYWLRNGKIHRIEQHPTRQQALEAAGLLE
jgi:ketosteroid isomerase-like protein